ncbi:hypothetical protein [Allorhizocola rhizosphaerae]|uniref:hypothetical protein n=1 Tax=Allorhizocola rhizosphaerae TaxID=1872709 RepID=UPI0013C33330|nr:hypothetical protein [Allorhizocola rhizosphaerae]
MTTDIKPVQTTVTDANCGFLPAARARSHRARTHRARSVLSRCSSGLALLQVGFAPAARLLAGWTRQRAGSARAQAGVARPLAGLARLRAVAAVLTGLAVLGLATGCPGPAGGPMGVDEQRLAAAMSEPVVALDKQPSARAGFQSSKQAPAKRGSVVADLSDEVAQSPDVTARNRTKEFMGRLRAEGWTVYLAACIPPRPPGLSPPQADAIPAVQFEDGWTFVAYGYKVIHGVSYFASLEGRGSSGNNRAQVSLLLRIPQSTEPTPDLFADRPPALDTGASCIEATQPPAARTITGPAIEVDSDGPNPDGTPKPNGHR